MLVATFGPKSEWPGKPVQFDNGQFLRGDDRVTISAADVMEYDRKGWLDWPMAGMRAWVGSQTQPSPGGSAVWAAEVSPEEAGATAARRVGASPPAGQHDAQVAEADLHAFLDSMRSGVTTFKVSACPPPIALKRDEFVALAIPEVILREPRTVRQGVYGGPRVRLAKNLSFNFGGFRAAPHEELHDVDSGDLVITSKRVAFLGSKRTASANLAQIVSVEPYLDAVAIHRTNKQRTEMYCNLDRHKFCFHWEEREHWASLTGVVVACVIEGQMVEDDPAPPPARQRASTAKDAGPADVVDELARLAALHDSGSLTDEEFAAFKAKLLG